MAVPVEGEVWSLALRGLAEWVREAAHLAALTPTPERPGGGTACGVVSQMTPLGATHP